MKNKKIFFKLYAPKQKGFPYTVPYRKGTQVSLFVQEAEVEDSEKPGNFVRMDAIGIIGNRAGLIYLAKNLFSIASMNNLDEATHYLLPGLSLLDDSLLVGIYRIESLEKLTEDCKKQWPPKPKKYTDLD